VKKSPIDSPKTAAKTKGDWAENQALDFLAAKGLTLVKKNFCCRTGEIDLIMQHGKDLVFIEVRSRSKNSLMSAAESITTHKKQKIIRAAQYFLLLQFQNQPPSCRFDVVCLELGDSPPVKIEWIQNAFF
jgi:putative endonuclease